MRVIFLLPFILFGLNSSATDYYLSNAGNDANAGTTSTSPWQTINKLNSFTGLRAGDNVFFKRGDTFYGTITIKNSGSAGNPIVFGAYGTGANPILTGLTTLSVWTNEGNGIYSAPLNATGLHMVTVDGVAKGMGRYPNTGYLNYEGHNANSSITDNQLTGTPNWTGAEVVIRKVRWILDRHVITSHSGGTLTFNAVNHYGNNNGYTPINGNGYFIQNSLSTLDVFGEWYFNPGSGKLYMYFGSRSPSSSIIKASSQDKNINISNNGYITLSNLDIEGGNTQLVASYS